MILDFKRLESFCIDTKNREFLDMIKDKIITCNRLKDKELRKYVYISIEGEHIQGMHGRSTTSDLVMNDLLASELIKSIELSIENDIAHFQRTLPKRLKKIVDF